MVQETYDWSTAYSDEDDGTTTTFTSGSGDTVDISVSQPDPGGYYSDGGDGFETGTQGGDSSGHFVMGTDQSTNIATNTTTIDFSSNSATGADSVTDPSFTLYDLDSPTSASYQDQVTILAYDSDGNLLPVTLTATDPSVVDIDGSTATAILGAGGNDRGNVDSSSSEGNVEVSITGDVSQIVIVYGNGSLSDSDPAYQHIGISDLTFDLQTAVIFFTRGTRILTSKGEVPIEDLAPGDLVMTADRGMQPLRWLGVARISGKGKTAPVRFAAGTIGNQQELLVSPQHRVMLSGWKPDMISGHDEVLVTAKHLVNGNDIIQTELDEVEYYHLMFDHHEIVFAEGAPCESLFISRMSLKGMSQDERDEISLLFPDLYNNPKLFGDTARPCLREFETRLVA